MENTTNCRCGRCNRVLKNQQAIEAGYGAVCYRKTFGGRLPGKGRALHHEKAQAASSAAAGRSDFNCHLRTGGGNSILVIEDLDAGGMSVTNNIEAVVKEAAERLGITLSSSTTIIYRDSDGTYDGVRASIGDAQLGFYHLGQKDENAAIAAALSARGGVA